ncbi:Shedu immune nuclease family protein [Sphingomonas aestuarii]
MIEAFSKLLRRKTVEADWQELLELNPFILAMLFGQPIVVLQPSASVGGMTLAGSGNKIADFLSQNALTYNAALVEIKRPSTALMQGEYRKNVFAPSPELMGAVVQVLDQRSKLVTSLPLLKHFGDAGALQAYSVDCVIIAGRIPPAERVASFELMRSQLKDVRIITFDELLERLHMLREMLAGDRYISPVDEEDFDIYDMDDEFGEFHQASRSCLGQDDEPADEPF